MFDATKLLGSMVESRAAPSAANRLNAAMRKGTGAGPLDQLLSQLGGASAQSGGLGGLLGNLLGGRTGGGQGGMSDTLGGLADMARRAMSSPRQEFERNNPAAVGGLGALAGALLGGGRGAIGGGLMAVLGSLAYSALQGQGQDQGQGRADAPSASAGTGPSGQATPASLPGYEDPANVQRKALLMLRAMIQTAKADGQIDANEMNRIVGRLDEAGEDREARDFVLQQLRSPVDIDALARDATSPQDTAEIYAASLMAIEVDTQAERDYLARLASALNLSQPVADRIKDSLEITA